jgi:cation diffusion facilitator family transporter
MHTETLERWQHEHVFLGAQHARNERKTWAVIALTTAMMVAEIAGGTLFGSLALVADGLHMSTHAGALLIAALAYSFARRHARDPRFAFGTGKIGDLGGFTSAIVLAMIALLIGYEAIERLLAPVPIAFPEAIGVACIGLVVNLASVWLLREEPHHHRDHAADHDDDDDQHRRDHNLSAAYVHVLADAATSFMAIAGLSAAWLLGWVWIDAVVGMIGAAVIANWSYRLVHSAGRVLLDILPDPKLAARIRATLEQDGARVTDLHLWRVGPGHFGVIVALVTHTPEAPAAYKARLAGIGALAHVTVEVEACH